MPATERTPILDPTSLTRLLAIRDLTDPSQGPHAVQLLVDAVVADLAAVWGCEVRVVRGHPVVPVAEAFDRLGHPPDAAVRESRHTRVVGPGRVLRSTTTSLVPAALAALAAAPVDDVLLVCPGITYRRDQIDRLHSPTPHQLDLWRVTRGRLGPEDLRAMVDVVVGALVPGARRRCTPTTHPSTTGRLQVDVAAATEWVELGECGLARPDLLARHRLAPARWAGLAMGVGLDRALMLRKGVGDIRLLRSDDPRVARQLLDLEPYRPVSRHPPVRRDLSVAVEDDDDVEAIGDRVREALGDDAASVEAVEVVAETPGAALSDVARHRIGLRPGQRNLLVRLTLRHPTRSLTRPEANRLRDRVWTAVHRGERGAP